MAQSLSSQGAWVDGEIASCRKREGPAQASAKMGLLCKRGGSRSGPVRPEDYRLRSGRMKDLGDRTEDRENERKRTVHSKCDRGLLLFRISHLTLSHISNFEEEIAQYGG
jgi:hypothetical protein